MNNIDILEEITSMNNRISSIELELKAAREDIKTLDNRVIKLDDRITKEHELKK